MKASSNHQPIDPQQIKPNHTMKKNYLSKLSCWAAPVLAFVLCGLALSAHAADRNPPDLMSYQGYVTDNNGDPLGNTGPKNYDIIFRIWSDQVSTVGKLWEEQQTVTVDKGYFSVLLGEGAQSSQLKLSNLFTNTADASERFVEMTVKGIGSGSPPADLTIAPRLRLLTSPYAFLARNAVNAQALANSAAAQIVTVASTSVGINTATPGSALDVNGTVTASGLTVNGPATLNSSVTLSNGAAINGQNVLEFGKGIAGKDVNAGKIGYRTFDLGLNITGAGATGHRVVSILAEDGTVTYGGVGVNRGNVGAGYMLDVNGAARVSSLTSSNTVTAVSFSGNGIIPIGGIIMWSGNTPLTGWHLCDGGTYFGVQTPDLRDKFIVGSGSAYALKATGGSATHTLSGQEMPSHTHNVAWKSKFSGRDSNTGGAIDVQEVWGIDSTPTGTTPSGATGDGTSFSTLPPYYALAYIMRVQ